MTRTVLARVIGANKVRRRPFKTRVRSAAGPSRAPSPGARAAAKQPTAPALRSQPARRRRSQTAPQPGPNPADQISRAIKAKQDSTARVLPCVNCAWAQSVVGYSLLQGGADG